MAKLSERDITTFKYFFYERGGACGVTRWSSWEEKKPLFQDEFPSLITAMTLLELAKEILRTEVDEMKIEGDIK